MIKLDEQDEWKTENILFREKLERGNFPVYNSHWFCLVLTKGKCGREFSDCLKYIHKSKHMFHVLAMRRLSWAMHFNKRENNFLQSKHKLELLCNNAVGSLFKNAWEPALELLKTFPHSPLLEDSTRFFIIASIIALLLFLTWVLESFSFSMTTLVLEIHMKI